MLLKQFKESQIKRMDTVVDATGQRFHTASGKDYGMDGSDTVTEALRHWGDSEWTSIATRSPLLDSLRLENVWHLIHQRVCNPASNQLKLMFYLIKIFCDVEMEAMEGHVIWVAVPALSRRKQCVYFNLISLNFNYFLLVVAG